MARPKSSIVGLGDFAVGLYTANKTRKMTSEFDDIRRSQAVGTEMVLNSINSVVDLQVASMHGLRSIDSKLEILSKISWDIASYFERKEAREDFLGDLKMVVISLEGELDDIDELSEDYLEYATMQVETLQSLVDRHDVRIEHFKTMPPGDIKWVRSVLKRIEGTHSNFLSRLEESDGD